MPTRLLIADDHEVVRRGLRGTFADLDDIEVVADAVDGPHCIELARKHRPDVVLLDVRMPRGDGLATLSRLRADLPNAAVVMFTGFDNPTYVARAAALGAAGYLNKSIAVADLIKAVRRAAAGETLWSTEELRKVTGALATPRAATELEAPLTKRESEVLKQLAHGLSNREIAVALEISYETVKEHVQHILRKLGVADRTQAAVWAVRKGVV